MKFFCKYFIYLFNRKREHSQGEQEREKQLPGEQGDRAGLIPGPWIHCLCQRLMLNQISHLSVPIGMKFND